MSVVCGAVWQPLAQAAQTSGKGPAASPREWSIFVYVAGDASDVRESTFWALQRMESISALRGNQRVNLIAQFDDLEDDPNYRYRFNQPATDNASKNGLRTRPIPESEIRQVVPDFRYQEQNSGDPRTLKEFLRWGVKAYPAQHYALILLGHSWGIQGHMQDFHFDGQTRTRSSLIKNYEMRRLLEELYEEQSSLIPEKRFDLLLLDSCTTGGIEIALEFKDVFSYFAGSSIETPYYGVDYARALDLFIRTVNTPAKTTEPTPAPHADLEAFLRSLTSMYVLDHVRGGPGLLQEHEYTPMAFFAVRTESLNRVSQALAALLRTVQQTPFPHEFRSGAYTALDRIIDTDDNIDLFELARVLVAEFSHRYATTRQEIWRTAASDAKGLQDSLDYQEQTALPSVLRVHHPPATEAWVHIEIDSVNPSGERAVCDSLRLFALLNRHLSPELLPRFLDATGVEISVNDFLCEGRPTRSDRSPFRNGKEESLLSLFDLQIKWPLGIPARFVEQVSKSGVRQRTLSVYFASRNKESLDERPVVGLPGTREVSIEYFSAGPKLLTKQRVEIPDHIVYHSPSKTGLYVAEAHSNSTLYKHGLGILLLRTFNENEQPYWDGRSPLELLERPPLSLRMEHHLGDLEQKGELYRAVYRRADFYRLHRISETGWPDFLFGRVPLLP